MHTRRLGTIEVSPIGVGTMAFSHGYGKIPEEEYSVAAIRAAYDFGADFFDTSEVYSPNMQELGHNERIVGKALSAVRKNVTIATKVMMDPAEIRRDGGVYQTMKRHLIASMERLRTDYIDLYYWHRYHPDIPLEEVAAGMGKLIEEGLIRGWGLSQVSGETLRRAHAVTPVAAVQNLYNMLERDCETDIFPVCMENGIGVVPFSPIASGFLSGKITAETEFEKEDDVRNWVPQLSKENIAANRPVLDVLGKFASAKGATNAQISLAWMLHKYPNVVPIPGSKNKERILENLGAWNVALTDGEFAALERALDACRVYGHRGHVEDMGTVHTSHTER